MRERERERVIAKDKVSKQIELVAEDKHCAKYSNCIKGAIIIMGSIANKVTHLDMEIIHTTYWTCDYSDKGQQNEQLEQKQFIKR